MAEPEIYILNAPGQSGKAYRVEALTPTQVDKTMRDASLRAEKDIIDLHQTRIRLGIARCVKAITRGPVPMKETPVLENGKPKMRAVLDGRGQPRHAEGKPIEEPVIEMKADQTWLKDPKNWHTPDVFQFEMDYDAVIPTAKDDFWLDWWWRNTHEMPADAAERILSKVQRVS